MMDEGAGDQSSHHPQDGPKPVAEDAMFAEMPIAIIGMGCRFPGDADCPDRFWELCSNGRSAWSEIPESRFNKDSFYHPLSEKNTTVSAHDTVPCLTVLILET